MSEVAPEAPPATPEGKKPFKLTLAEWGLLLVATTIFAVTRIWCWPAPTDTVGRWLAGAGVVSGVVGGLVTYAFWSALHRYGDNEKWPGTRARIKPFPVAIGVLERIFFTVLIAFDVSGTGGGLIGWLALKLAVGWQRLKGKTDAEETGARARAFAGLSVGLISLLLAVFGGLICRASRK